eukprot:snap_masked-scaffold_15-processed-gene-5.22-mRNA-1 protein AED:1.00 eAED:1.00 QI:0/-1/0/0/-1/1/1/0/96
MTQGWNELLHSEYEHPLASNEEVRSRIQFRRALNIICVNADGAGAKKVIYFLSLNSRMRTLMIQEIHNTNFKELKEKTSVNPVQNLDTFLAKGFAS